MEFKIKKMEEPVRVSGIANVHFFEFDKSYSTLDDKHPFAELLFVNTGVLLVQSEPFSGELHKSELIIHPANTLHSLRCTDENAPSVIIIGFECDSPKLELFARRPVRLSEANVKKLAEIVKEGRNVFAPPYNVPVYDMRVKKKQPFGSEQLLKNLIEYFLVGLIREYSRGSEAQENDPSSFSIREVVNYVEQNYLEKVTIDELAFLFGSNRSSLCKAFKEATGLTVIEYINDKKLRKAKELIRDTNKTLTQIAEELNFETIHYFSRFFTKQTGISPRQYRTEKE